MRYYILMPVVKKYNSVGTGTPKYLILIVYIYNL